MEVFIALLIIAVVIGPLILIVRKRQNQFQEFLTENEFVKSTDTKGADEFVQDDKYIFAQKEDTYFFTAKYTKPGLTIYQLTYTTTGFLTRQYTIIESGLKSNFPDLIIASEGKALTRKWSNMQLVKQLELNGRLLLAYSSPNSGNPDRANIEKILSDQELINLMTKNWISAQVLKGNIIRVYGLGATNDNQARVMIHVLLRLQNLF